MLRLGYQADNAIRSTQFNMVPLIGDGSIAACQGGSYGLQLRDSALVARPTRKTL
jgi:hypothetical protein